MKFFIRMQILLLLAWAATAVMAQTTALPTPKIALPDLSPWMYVVIACGIAFWGAASATIQRWASGAETKAPWKTLVLRDFILGQTAGFIAFFACIHWNVEIPLAAIAVLVSSYGSNKILDMALAFLESWVNARKPPTPPTPPAGS